jgi:hypothetical protein
MKTHPRAKFHLISPTGYRETRVHGRTHRRTNAHTTTILISRQSLRRPAGITIVTIHAIQKKKKNDRIADVQERAANAKNVNWIDYKITETTDHTYRHPKAYISPTAITLTCALCWCRQRRRTGTDVGWSHRGARRLSR